jgi:FixJ family two-component response regulator
MFYQGAIDCLPLLGYYPDVDGFNLCTEGHRRDYVNKVFTESIAIIDDDALVRQSLEDCMESAGYSVESFDSAEQLLASGSAQDLACLIVDIQLPGITGLELQSRLGGTDNGVPIVFVSAQGTQANIDRAIRQGAAGFLSKPFRRDDLVKLVGTAIRR